MLKPAERGYIAGIADGEGSFCLYCNGNGRWFSPAIQISSTNKAVLEWINLKTGLGRVHSETKKYPSGKLLWTFQVSGQGQVKEFLELILPYLRIKKPVAKLVYRYCVDHIPKHSNRYLGRRPPEEWVVTLYHQIRVLNSGIQWRVKDAHRRLQRVEQ